MKKGTGITLDRETNDLDIQVRRDAIGMITGGLVIGKTTEQNQKMILFMQPAEIKDAPTVGVGIESLLNSHEALLYKHKTREQLEADGMRVSYLDIKVTNDNEIKIKLNAQY